MSSPFSDAYFSKSLADRIAEIGHRAFVGGGTPERWYGIGKLQHHMLVSEAFAPLLVAAGESPKSRIRAVNNILSAGQAGAASYDIRRIDSRPRPPIIASVSRSNPAPP